MSKNRIRKARCWVVGCSCDDCRGDGSNDYYLDEHGNASATKANAREFLQFSDADAARQACAVPGNNFAVFRRGRPS